MAHNHTFTQNIHGDSVDVDLDQVEKVEDDSDTKCTRITLRSGEEINVSDDANEVRKLVRQAQGG